MQPNVSIITGSLIVGFLILAYLLHFLQRQKSKTISRLIHADSLVSMEDVKAILTIAQQQRVSFVVRINGKGKPYSSSIIKIDTSSNAPTLLIDGLIPKEGNTTVKNSQFLSIEFFLKKTSADHLNIPYIFDAIYVNRETYEGYTALRISCPTSIKRNQRRKYHRVEPSVKEPVYIYLTLENTTVTENVANISGGGVGFYTNLDKSVLWAGRQIASVRIALPEQVNITCKLIVRWIAENEPKKIIDGKPYRFYCGAELAGLDDTMREKIIRYAIERERAELRRMSREFE